MAVEESEASDRMQRQQKGILADVEFLIGETATNCR